MLKWVSPLILALPVALAGVLLGWRPVLIFVLALVSLVPLAGVIGAYTERLGEYIGEVAGGLLDATFGNAPEIIIGILLIAGLFPVTGSTLIVKALIIGSIVSNSLLVLGSSIFFGALRNGRMQFSADHAGSYASMLALAVAGLALPAMAVFLGTGTVRLDKLSDQLQLSAVVSVVLLLSYFAYLAATIFHLGEHARPAHQHAGSPAQESRAERHEEQVERAAEQEAELVTSVLAEAPAGEETEAERLATAEEDDEERERRRLAEKRRGHMGEIWKGIGIVALATALTVVASVVLVSAMGTVIARTANTPYRLTPFFVGFVLLPLITNAVEHAGALTNALANRMEEAMSVAAGSSVQMALLVAPVLVLISLAVGHPLTLVFSKLELIVVTLVTFVYALVSLDGETTWLEGLQLVAFYVMVAATAFFLPGTS
jgi:Ca2+:H+ antiporter